MILKGYNWWVICHFASSSEVEEQSGIHAIPWKSTEFLETEKICICSEHILKFFEKFDCQKQWSWEATRGTTFYSQRLSSWEAQ